METFYLWLSNLIVIIHFLFILFVLFGGLFVLHRPRMIWLHLPAALWGVLVEFKGWYCPLTPLENYLRHLAGEEAYQADFVAEYLLPLIYPAELTHEIQLVFGSMVIIVNVVVYGIVLRRYKRVL